MSGHGERRHEHPLSDPSRNFIEYVKKHKKKHFDKEKGHGRKTKALRDFLRKKTSILSDDEEDED